MIVLTGSESFIGKVLKRQLASAGREFIALDSLPPAGGSHVQADITGDGFIDHVPDRAEAIVHLAAISRDPDCKADPKKAFLVNVNGTLNVIEAARRKNIPQVIFASSEWVYGDVGESVCQTEDMVLNPAKSYSEYALTKLIGEQLFRLEAARSGLAATVLRFGIVYGPRPDNWSAVEQLFDKVRRGLDIQVGSLRTARRFIHVEDICSGIRAVIGRRGYEIYNLSGDSLVSLGNVIATSGKILGKETVPVESNPSAISIRNPDNALFCRTFDWKPAIDLPSGLESLREFFDQSSGGQD